MRFGQVRRSGTRPLPSGWPLPSASASPRSRRSTCGPPTTHPVRSRSTRFPAATPDRTSEMRDHSPSAPRRASVLLIVSLCLNVLLIPVIAVIIFRAAHHVNAVGSGGVLAPRSVMAEAPAQKDRIETIIARHEPKIRALRAAAADARREAFRTLGAPDYTPDKFHKALA